LQYGAPLLTFHTDASDEANAGVRMAVWVPWRNVDAPLHEPMDHQCEFPYWVDPKRAIPARLAITLQRNKPFDYAVNIFLDGKVIFQSMGCPEDTTPKLDALQNGDIGALMMAFEQAHFSEARDCYPSPVTDQPHFILALLDEHGGKVVEAGRGGTPAALSDLADLVDRAAGTGRWIP
jgi:hypothetical protein